jgi:hypothetical protein
MMKATSEYIKSSQAEMRSTICAIQSELEETIQHETRAVIQPIWSELDETSACNEATETEPDPGTMQSVEEYQEIPKEEAAVMPIGGWRKRRRDWNLVVGRRQKPKGRIQASCESRRRLTVAGRKMFCHAAVAERKRNIFRKIWAEENCGPRKEFAAAGIRMTHCAKVARGREHGLQRQGNDDIAPRTQKGRTETNRRFKGPESKNGIRNRGREQQLYCCVSVMRCECVTNC